MTITLLSPSLDFSFSKVNLMTCFVFIGFEFHLCSKIKMIVSFNTLMHFVIWVPLFYIYFSQLFFYYLAFADVEIERDHLLPFFFFIFSFLIWWEREYIYLNTSVASHNNKQNAQILPIVYTFFFFFFEKVKWRCLWLYLTPGQGARWQPIEYGAFRTRNYLYQPMWGVNSTKDAHQIKAS